MAKGRLGGVIAILFVGSILRFAYLDADPDYYAWVGYITDEGRWVEHARGLALFGQATELDWPAHVHVAPLFDLAHVAVFGLLGVNLFTARLLTALSGVALLLTVWLLLRRVISTQAMFGAVVLLAFDVDLIMLSRVSVPEMAAIWLEMVAYCVLIGGAATPVRMALAGFCVLLAVATKATVLPTLLIFSVLVFVLNVRYSEGSIWHQLFSLWGGFACVPILAGVVLVGWRPQFDQAAIGDTFRVIGLLLAPASLYSVLKFPVESAVAPTLNVWAMAACLGLGGRLVTQGTDDDPLGDRLYVTSGVWCVLYLVIMLTFAYFPDRYKIHILPPLAVNIATGLSLLHRRGPTEVGDRLARPRWSRRLVAAACFGVPTAAFAAPMLASAYGFVGGNPAQLRVRILCILVATIISVGVVIRRMQNGHSYWPFIVFPIAATLIWLLSIRTGIGARPFWPDEGLHGVQAWWLATGWTTLPVAWVGTLALGRWTGSWRLRAAPVVASAIALLAIVRIIPSYVHPHYTMKETARQLEVLLRDVSGTIATSRAEGLFNGNRLHYRAIPDDWEWRPDVLVIAFFPLFRDPGSVVEHEYREMNRFELFVSPEYDDASPARAETTRPRETVRLYQRKRSGEVVPASSGG